MALSCVLRGFVRQVRVSPISEILKTNVRLTSCLPQRYSFQEQKPVSWNNSTSLVIDLRPTFLEFSILEANKACEDGDYPKRVKREKADKAKKGGYARRQNIQVSAVKPFSTTAACKSAHGDHSKVWTAERFLAAGLLGILPAAMLVPSQPLDILMALSIVMHMHWGIEAIVVDYVRPSIFGNVIPKVGVMLVYALSIGILAGLLNFIFNDVGLANGIRMLWKL